MVSPTVIAANKAFCDDAAAANDTAFALGHMEPSDPGYQQWLDHFVETSRGLFDQMAATAPPSIAADAKTMKDFFDRPDVAQIIGHPSAEAGAAEEHLRKWLKTNCGFAWGIEGGDSSRVTPGSSVAPRSPGSPIRTVPPSTR